MAQKRIYIIGVGGVAMGNLAGLLKARGHEVAGSDGELYEPMKSMLKKIGVPVFVPYTASNIDSFKPDVVVVANAISRGNPELEYVLENRIRYISVVDALREEFIEGKNSKKPIVVAGTHGKTTTSALIAWILEYAKLDPSVFVGGETKNFETGFKLGNGEHIVIEGDEYDTAFFDKNPKFLGYRPWIGVLGNIEFDHADMYPNLEAVKRAFMLFLRLIPQHGLLVYGAEDENIASLLTSENRRVMWKGFPPSLVGIGIAKGDYTAKNITADETHTHFDILCAEKILGTIVAPLHGEHNVKNILVAYAVGQFLKIPHEIISGAIASFGGVKRRAEILGEKQGITLIDDYAHHPTAVAETLKGLRKRFQNRRLVVLFEPGSASSKRRVFEHDYVDALSYADAVFIYKPFKTEGMKADEVFSGEKIAHVLNGKNVPAQYIPTIEEYMDSVRAFSKKGDVLVIMSCRGFDGLREKMTQEFAP